MHNAAHPSSALSLAAALALGGTRAAPLNQGRYGYRGQPAVADCAEVCARELLNSLLWDAAAQRFDTDRLPPRAADALRSAGRDAQNFFELSFGQPRPPPN